jgi:hypothetical protein
VLKQNQFMTKRSRRNYYNVNVLYGLTRAEEQLYVISNMNLSRKGEVSKTICVLFY